MLGVGGVRMLRALGQVSIDRFHLNEGHAALAIPELIEELGVPPHDECENTARASRAAAASSRPTHRCRRATTDFRASCAKPLVGKRIAARLAELGVEDELNLTQVALAGSRFVNGVAMRHGEVSRGMFPGYPIRSITNGVHLGTWAAPSFRALFDHHIPHWRSDAFALRHATAIALDEIGAAHAAAKRRLLETVRDRAGRALDPNALTLGFGRRATAYKRADLVLSDLAALRRIRAERRSAPARVRGQGAPERRRGQADHPRDPPDGAQGG